MALLFHYYCILTGCFCAENCIRCRSWERCDVVRTAGLFSSAFSAILQAWRREVR